MPMIDEFMVPDALLRELLAVVDQAKASALLALAKIDPSLGRGLRPTLMNAKFIRQRLAAKVSAPTKLSEKMRDFLAHEGLNSQLVIVFSEAVLLATFTELLAIYGREAFLAAIIVDDRPEVRQLAVDYCQQEAWQTRALPERQVALASLGGTLQPFLQAIDPLLNSVGSRESRVFIEDEKRSAEIQGYRQKIVELEERLQKERAEKRSDKKIDSKIEAYQRHIGDLEGKLTRERHVRQAAETARSNAEAREQLLREAHSREVMAGINAAMQGVVRTWLAEPLRVGEAVDALTSHSKADILEQVKAILMRQEERDRHFGNMRRLRGRLEELRQAKVSLLRAASEAINPLPDLTSLIVDVQREMDRLESLLDEKSPVSPTIQRLVASIRQAECQEDLERSRRLLLELEASNCFDHTDIRLLYGEYHTCLGRIFEPFAPHPRIETKSDDPALIVNRGFAKGERFLWLLDGYNILFRMEDIFAESYEDDHPAAQSRKRLLEMVQNLLTGTDNLADVFFDGEEPGQANVSPQVKVVYSGGGGNKVRNRADQAIIECLERRQAGDEISTVVVTDDRDLGKHCQVLGAKVMPVQEFAAYLTR